MTDGVSTAAIKAVAQTNETTKTNDNSAKISDTLKELAESAKTKSIDKTQLADLSILDLQKELEQLQVERKLNVSKIEKYEAEVKSLAEQAAASIKEAIKEQDETVQEHEEKTQTAVQTEINKYIEANKKKQGSMSKADLANNISNAVGKPNLSKSLEKLLNANEQIAQIDDYLSQINTLTIELEGLDLSISSTNSAIESAQKKAEEEAKSSDPIGFNIKKDGKQVKYDFIVDDGNFDSTSDFLGAKNQWESMKALDVDGDGIVNAKELKEGKIKAVKTDSSGNKTIVDLAEEFGDDFKVKLNSYKSGGTYSGIDSKADADGNGVADQKLLGTFKVNIDGKDVKGYNTLDDNEYLKSTYGISADSADESEDVKIFKNFFITYTQKSSKLKTQVSDAFSKQGLSKSSIELLDTTAKTDANIKASEFDKKLQKQVDKEQRAKLEAEAEAKIQKIIDDDKTEEAKKTEEVKK